MKLTMEKTARYQIVVWSIVNPSSMLLLAYEWVNILRTHILQYNHGALIAGRDLNHLREECDERTIA